MAKGDRASLESLLHSAWERQTALRAKGRSSSDTNMPKIPPKDLKLLWISFALALGATCVISLIAGSGTLLRWSVIALVIVGSLSFLFGFYGLGWLKGFIRGLFVVVLVCSAMTWLGYRAWPSPPRIEISKELGSASAVGIAPRMNADVGVSKDDFTIAFTLCENTGKTFLISTNASVSRAS